MTTSVEQRVVAPQAPGSGLSHGELIEGARQRRRRLRRILAAVVVAAAVGTILYLDFTQSSSSASPRTGSSASQPASTAVGVSPKLPGALAIAKNGDLLVIDAGRNQILERPQSGRFRIFAGTGDRGFSGDGGPAAEAELNHPSAMAVARDGSVYVADTDNNRVRRISPTGFITTVAGDGNGGWTRSRLRATHAPVADPSALTFGPDRRLYIVTGGWGELLRMDTRGTLTRLAGTRDRHAGIFGLRHAATDASIDAANGLAFDSVGNLYLAGSATKTLLMIGPDGIMRAPLGTKIGFYPRGPGGLTTTPTGHVLAIETQAIVELTPHSEKTLYSFAHDRGIAGITGFLPAGIAVGSHRVYTDTGFGNGWSNGSAILALDVTRRRAKALWSHQGA